MMVYTWDLDADEIIIIPSAIRLKPSNPTMSAFLLRLWGFIWQKCEVCMKSCPLFVNNFNVFNTHHMGNVE